MSAGSTTVGEPTFTTKKTFVAGDRSEKSGVATDRATTKELGKSYKERPAKTEKRIAAQAKGETSYDAGKGKKEYSGRMKEEHGVTSTIKRTEPKVERTPGSTSISITKTPKKLKVRRTSGAKGTQNRESGIFKKRKNFKTLKSKGRD